MAYAKSFGWKPGDTSDATAEQWHIKSGKTAYIASGKVTGNAYTPAMMQYDGTTGYYFSNCTTSGNLATVVTRFRCAPFTGGGIQRLFSIAGPSAGLRASALFYASDHADSGRAGKILVQSQNSAGTNICRLISQSGYIDDTTRMLFYTFNGNTGAAAFYINDTNADDTGHVDRIAPTTGTLSSGASSTVYVATDTNNFFGGRVGPFGYRDAYLTNRSDFMHPDGIPKELDVVSWTEWGAQPLFWNEHGQMDNNLGSAGNMTRNGTIVVGNGGNT